MTRRPLDTVVCGSTFGQFYLAALAALPDHFRIVGLVAKGSARSLSCAQRQRLPLYADIAALPDSVDLVCVAVRSGALGGAGTDLALQALERGFHVLIEQPIHIDDLGACLRAAKRHDRRFAVGDLYPRLPAVRRFVAAARAAAAKQAPLFLDLACATQVSFPLVHLLAQALPTLHPWEISDPVLDAGPLQMVRGRIGGVPFVLRAHNEVDPADPDNHLLMLHRVGIGFPGGTLSLTDTHGPVLWHHRLHVPDAVKRDFDFAPARTPDLAEAGTCLLGPVPSVSLRETLADSWPQAIGDDLLALHAAILSGEAPVGEAQRLLTCCHVWQALTGALGYPALRPERHHAPLPASLLRLAVGGIGEHDFSPSAGDPASAVDLAQPVTIAETMLGTITVEETQAFMARLDDAVLLAMLSAFQQGGTLDRPDRDWSEADILIATAVAPQHHHLVRRWLHCLVDRRHVERRGDRFAGSAPVERARLEQAWAIAASLWDERLGNPAFITYLRVHALDLPVLLRGDQPVSALLFPQGETHIADAIYRDTLPARYANTLLAESVRRLVGDDDGPIRILEVGAGTGATTEQLVPLLHQAHRSGREVDYLFTDISPFFLDAARVRFADCAWMRFGVLDIDSGRPKITPEELRPDIVLAAGVLNNVRNADDAIRRIVGLAQRGGWLMMSEPVGEQLSILASQAFMMPPPTDERARTGATFLSEAQWRATLGRAGMRCAAVFPPDGHPLAPLGQRVFLAKVR